MTGLLDQKDAAMETLQFLRERTGRDKLTGLLNRDGWDRKVGEYQKLAERHSKPLAFIVCDLDGLKETNDSIGHEAGDKLIKDFADVLRQSVRETDVAARYAGDEFAVLLPDTTEDEAKELVRRILAKSVNSKIGVSVGVGNDFSSADQEMYIMKNSNKNG